MGASDIATGPRWAKPLLRVALILTIISIVLCAAPARALADNRAAKIKAAVFYYVLKFVEWSSLRDESALKVCFIQSDPILEELSFLIVGKKIQGRTPVLRKVSSPNDIRSCHVLYLPDIADSSELAIVAATPQLITICSVASRRALPCTIQIYEEGNPAKVALSRGLLSTAGFKVSSELLEVAIDSESGRPLLGGGAVERSVGKN